MPVVPEVNWSGLSNLIAEREALSNCTPMPVAVPFDAMTFGRLDEPDADEKVTATETPAWQLRPIENGAFAAVEPAAGNADALTGRSAMVWVAVSAVTEQVTGRIAPVVRVSLFEPLLSGILVFRTPLTYCADVIVPPVMLPVFTSSTVPETLKLPLEVVLPNDESAPQVADGLSATPWLFRMRIPTPVSPVVKTPGIPGTGVWPEVQTTTGMSNVVEFVHCPDSVKLLTVPGIVSPATSELDTATVPYVKVAGRPVVGQSA